MLYVLIAHVSRQHIIIIDQISYWKNPTKFKAYEEPKNYLGKLFHSPLIRKRGKWQLDGPVKGCERTSKSKSTEHNTFNKNQNIRVKYQHYLRIFSLMVIERN